MRVAVDVSAELLVEVSRGGEEAVRAVALDWLLRVREGSQNTAGVYLVKGLSGAVLSVRPWVENPRITTGARKQKAEPREFFPQAEEEEIF